MSQRILFKTLVDILFLIHCFGLIGFILVLPVGFYTTDLVQLKMSNFDFGIDKLPVWYWSGIFLSILAYIFLLLALAFLRRMARILLTRNFFLDPVIEYGRKTGKFFLFSGSTLVLVYIILWLGKLFSGKVQIDLGTDIIIPFFLLMIGLFFKLQAEALQQGKELKEENELTI
ncbi:DUF2975 domain-containing protein [Croceiramulus getboli]|nr:DUF2975 domain-containing protein [Flavobacteriaceae bacterium YJPT1-3]